MPGRKRSGGKPPKRPIERYEHRDKKRINNPPVGLVTPETDPVAPAHKAYDYITPVPSVKPRQELDYDPHLDPQLVWAGKKEHSSFEVPTVSLHVHERIDPRTIINAVRKRNGTPLPVQPSLFERREENPPLREAIDFYRHAHGWSNRLIAGDSLLVMNSLLEKEGMAGQVQMAYIDPPYGIKYGSNFQPFINKRDVRDGRDEDLTQEPEMIRAFRDTWELHIHSCLTYLRDRLLLIRDLLHESGSCFVQISDDNVHLVRNLMDETFGANNFISLVTFSKTTGATVVLLPGTADYLLWYAKNKESVKYRRLFSLKSLGGEGAGKYDQVELPEIGNLISECFYDGRLQSAPRTVDATLSIALPRPVTWITTARISDRFEVPKHQSFSNPCEARAILQLLKNLNNLATLHKRRFSVAVLSGYREHKQDIDRNLAPVLTELKSLDIDGNTVDAFQGREADIAVYSVTRCNQSGQIGFLREGKRLNVALSRGREYLVIVGDHLFCRDAKGENPLRKIVSYIESHPEQCIIREAQK